MSSLPVRAGSAASFVLLLLAACSSDSSTKTPGPAKTDSGSSTPATFTNGVLPILSDSCALTACHSSGQSNLGIHLTYNADQVYAELQKESPTHPGLKFVVPGKPDESYLMAKIDGTQAKLPACTDGCGNTMPPDDPLPQAKRDVIRQWITNGAKQD